MASSQIKKSPPGRLSGIAIAVCIVLLLALLEFFGAFESLERMALDWRFVLRGPQKPHPLIILVTIDEATRRDMKKATNAITRAEYGQALENLFKAGAPMVAFDLDLATAREGDEEFAQTIACATGYTILSSFIAMGDWVHPNPLFLKPDRLCESGEAIAEAPTQTTVGADGVAIIYWKTDPKFNPDGFRVYYSIEPFENPKDIAEGTGGFVDVEAGESSLHLTIEGVAPGSPLGVKVVGLQFGSPPGEGAVNVIEDPDGKIRSMPMIVGRSADDPEVRAALPLEIALKFAFCPFPKLEKSTASNLTFSCGTQTISFPLVDGKMLINYRGGRDTFDRLSFSKILNGQFDPAQVNGKIVFVGNTHQLAHDEYPTPFGHSDVSALDTSEKKLSAGYTSGLEIHANALDTLLSENFISPLALILDGKFADPSVGTTARRLRIWDTSIVFVLAALTAALFVFLRLPLGKSSIILILLAGGISFASFVVFDKYNIWTPIAGPLVAVASLYTTGLLVRARLHEAERAWIKNTFGKYLAPTVVEQLIANPELVELGGTEKQLTAFFSDIEKFSTISEQLGSPARLVELLNEYLGAMAGIIEKHGGTVDKYEGDAIIAFWGAPLDFEDHAKRACDACLDMQERLKTLRTKWRGEDRWPDLAKNMHVRMGLNTGQMVVGNMGSEGHMNYTIMGDAVNLASRLEGANKEYGTYIMMSHNTYWPVRAHFEARPLDLLAVVGKKEPVRVYELMSRISKLDESALRMKRAYEDGLLKYDAREWDEAIALFETALQFAPDDGPSKTYIARCRAFKENPPPPDWDKVFRLKSK